MSGPNKQQLQKQNEIQDSEIAIARSSEARADEAYRRSQAAISPAEKYYSAVTKGGDSFMTAIAPIISQIDTSKKKTKEAIYDQLPAGPARDSAIAENERGSYDSVAKVKNFSFIDALDKLANIGSGLGSFSLQNTGAALSGDQAAANTGRDIMADETARKAARMNAIGGLVGVGGNLAGAKIIHG